MLGIKVLFAAAFAQGTMAGWAKYLQCGATGGQALAMFVHFEYAKDECAKSPIKSFEAYSGAISPILGFREFCGGKDGDGKDHDDRFCGNMDLTPDTGFHIILDGHDVNLGKADETTYLELGSDAARVACDHIGYRSGPGDNAPVVDTWHGVKLPCV